MLTNEQVKRLLDSLWSDDEIVPATEAEVAAIEADYQSAAPIEISPERLARHRVFMDKLLADCV